MAKNYFNFFYDVKKTLMCMLYILHKISRDVMVVVPRLYQQMIWRIVMRIMNSDYNYKKVIQIDMHFEGLSYSYN